MRLLALSMTLLSACTGVPDATGTDAGPTLRPDAGPRADAVVRDAAPGERTILPCDAIGEVGVWEKINPRNADPLLDTDTSHGFVVDPINSGVVLMGAGDEGFFGARGVWITDDCGATWTKASGPGSELVNDGRQWAWLADPTRSGVFYTVSGYGHNGMYKTTNGGQDWFDVTPVGDGAPGFVAGPNMIDPENPDHLLLTWHAPCGPYDDHIGCFAESRNGGESWIEHYGDPPFAEEVRVYLLHGDTWVVPSGEGFLRTTNAGETWTRVSELLGGGHSSGSLYRSPTGAYYIGTGNGVIRSDDDGVTWTLHSETGQYAMGITSDGTTMYASTRAGILTSPESDGTHWTLMETPFDDLAEGCFLGYDPDHMLLYASCHGGSYPHGTNGLFRMRVR